MKEFEIKGIMLDPARVQEKLEVYKELIPMFENWGYNTLLWHYCDDPGSAVEINGYPEFSAKNAISVDDMKEIVQLATKHNIKIVPEVECFGHTAYITKLEKYAHLKDGVAGKEFASIAPFHPETRKIIKEILKQTAEIYSSEYIHIGMDETAFGDNPTTVAELAKGKKKYELFAEYINWVNDEVKALGKKTMIWGDHLRPVAFSNMSNALDEDSISDKIADLISKDIVICDWYYEDDMTSDRLEPFTKRGFKVITCPAASAYGMIAHPAKWNLDNIQQFTKIGFDNIDNGCIGSFNTIWCSGRYLTGTSLFSMAYGAELQNNNGEERCDFRKKFVEDTFGVKNDDIVKAIDILHEKSIRMEPFYIALPCNKSELKEATDNDINLIKELKDAGKEAFEILSNCEVRKNQKYFNDILVTAECFESIGNRFAYLANIYKKVAQSAKLNDDDKDTLEMQIKEAERIYFKAIDAWNQTRYENDPERDGQPGGGGYFVQRLCQSLAFLKEIK